MNAFNLKAPVLYQYKLSLRAKLAPRLRTTYKDYINQMCHLLGEATNLVFPTIQEIQCLSSNAD